MRNLSIMLEAFISEIDILMLFDNVMREAVNGANNGHAFSDLT